MCAGYAWDTVKGCNIDNDLNDRAGIIFAETKSEGKSSGASMAAPKEAIKLSELMANQAKYDGKTIVVAGECVKVNNGIMGKNWIHIQDGSKDKGKAADLTITTNESVQLGSQVAFQGKVALNKDFGAGYRYAIIIEEAVKK